MIGRALLRIGGAASLAIVLLHVAAVFWGPAGYRYLGAGERLAALAASGSPVPAAVTLGIGALFAVAAAVAFAAASLARWPAWLRIAIGAVTILYLLRGVPAIPQAIVLFGSPGHLPLRYLVFSEFALVVGLIHVAGLVCAAREPEA